MNYISPLSVQCSERERVLCHSNIAFLCVLLLIFIWYRHIFFNLKCTTCIRPKWSILVHCNGAAAAAAQCIVILSALLTRNDYFFLSFFIFSNFSSCLFRCSALIFLFRIRYTIVTTSSLSSNHSQIDLKHHFSNSKWLTLKCIIESNDEIRTAHDHN